MIVISTAQADLGLRLKTFSLKIIKLPTFSEITQDISKDIDIDPTTSDINTCITHYEITQSW